MNRRTLLPLVLLLAAIPAFLPQHTHAARRTVRVADYGLQPGSGQDALPVIRRIIDENKGVRGLQIRFDKGRYDFYPDAERQAAGKPTTAFALARMHDVEIDGGGCDWIFHGLMNPVRLTECRGTTLRNVRIDWQQPYNSQATIVSATDTYVDMAIDAERYPYVVAGDSLAFVGEYGLQRIVPEYTNLYDGTTHELLYQTRDVPLGRDMFRARVTDLGNGPGAFPLPSGHEACSGERRRLFPRTLHHQRHRDRGLRANPHRTGDDPPHAELRRLRRPFARHCDDRPRHRGRRTVGARFQHHRRRHALHRLHGRPPFRRLHGERFGRRFHERTRDVRPRYEGLRRTLRADHPHQPRSGIPSGRTGLAARYGNHAARPSADVGRHGAHRGLAGPSAAFQRTNRRTHRRGEHTGKCNALSPAHRAQLPDAEKEPRPLDSGDHPGQSPDRKTICSGRQGPQC